MAEYTGKFSNLITHELGTCLKDIYPLALDAYDVADKQGVWMMESEGRYLIPEFEQERLADAQGLAMQDKLYRWGTQYPHLIAQLTPNSKGRPHTTICSENLLITCHRVKYPLAFPPHAVYRKTSARSNQLCLLEMNDDVDERAYLFLLHGPSSSNPLKLGFLQFAMPAPRGKVYLATADLFKDKEFGEKAPTEKIETNAIITIKKIKNRTSL